VHTAITNLGYGNPNGFLDAQHSPSDAELMSRVVISPIYMPTLLIVNAAIAGLLDLTMTICKLRGCREKPNRDGHVHDRNVTPIINDNTGAGWVQAIMKFDNPMLLCVVYNGQQADGTSAAQMTMHGGQSNLPLNDILPLPA